MKQRILMGLQRIVTNYTEVIEFGIAFVLIIYGAYIASPLYVVDSSAMFAIVFDNSIYRSITGLIITIPAWPIVFFQIKDGLCDYSRHKRRKTLLLCLSVVYLYLSALRAITIGIFPILWIFTLALGFISAILYLRLT